MNSDSDPNLSS